MTDDERVADCDLRILIETYCFQSPTALSIHQRQLLSALTELRERRAADKRDTALTELVEQAQELKMGY